MSEVIQISFDSELIAKLASQGWRPSEFRFPRTGETYWHGSAGQISKSPQLNEIYRLILSPIPKPKLYRPPTFADLAKKCPLPCRVDDVDVKHIDAELKGIYFDEDGDQWFVTNLGAFSDCRIEATDER